jgi:hypothetical protein
MHIHVHHPSSANQCRGTTAFLTGDANSVWSATLAIYLMSVSESALPDATLCNGEPKLMFLAETMGGVAGSCWNCDRHIMMLKSFGQQTSSYQQRFASPTMMLGTSTRRGFIYPMLLCLSLLYAHHSAAIMNAISIRASSVSAKMVKYQCFLLQALLAAGLATCNTLVLGETQAAGSWESDALMLASLLQVISWHM